MTVVATLPQREPVASWQWIGPDDISDIWNTILDGLDTVAQFGDHWRAEDVYMALRQGQAGLHMAFVDGQYAGFVVAMPSRSYDGPVLHVWAVYAVPGKRRLRDECFAKLHELALSMKAKRITFTSPRKGWERLGDRYGFAPTLTIFECEVEP